MLQRGGLDVEGEHASASARLGAEKLRVISVSHRCVDAEGTLVYMLPHHALAPCGNLIVLFL